MPVWRRWKASASYLHYGSQEPSNRWFPNQIASPNQGVIYRKVDATQANSTFTVTPTTVITARYGFNRFPNFTPPISLGFDLTRLGFLLQRRDVLAGLGLFLRVAAQEVLRSRGQRGRERQLGSDDRPQDG